MKYNNETGSKHNRLNVIAELEQRSKDRSVMYLCICDCGNKSVVSGSNLRSGHIKSCGCLSSEKASKRMKISARKHGMFGTKVYGAWAAMKGRCENVNDKSYKNYGGRGIKVSKDWSSSFINFYKYIGDPPSPKHSLDRIDNDGDYKKGNVRWATNALQARNKRTNHLITYNNQTKTLRDWSDEKGIKYTTLLGRIKHGWSVEEALNKDVRMQTLQ